MPSILITFLASFLIWLMFTGIAILWIIDGRIKKEQALHAFFACFLAWAITQMIKELFPSIRPFHTNGNAPLTLTIPLDSAFPSGHTAVAFAMATSLWAHDKKLGAVFMTLALLVGIGRVLGNVHYNFDIMGGIIVGVMTAVATEKLHLHKMV
jgi:undecaprenyl-diphosphatase